MSVNYEHLVPEHLVLQKEIRDKKDEEDIRTIKKFLIMSSVCTFVISIFLIGIFVLFYVLISIFQNIKKAPILTKLNEIKPNEIENFLDVLRSVNTKEIKKILSNISYEDLVQVWEGIKVCIASQCYLK